MASPRIHRNDAEWQRTRGSVFKNNVPSGNAVHANDCKIRVTNGKYRLVRIMCRALTARMLHRALATRSTDTSVTANSKIAKKNQV